jgi:hypothetical protein
LARFGSPSSPWTSRQADWPEAVWPWARYGLRLTGLWPEVWPEADWPEVHFPLLSQVLRVRCGLWEFLKVLSSLLVIVYYRRLTSSYITVGKTEPGENVFGTIR